MDQALLHTLRARSFSIRHDILRACAQAGSGHVTSCFSAVELLTVLYSTCMRIDIAAHDNPANDRFILSKGHAAPLLYALWKQMGVISEDELMTLRHISSRLEGHPTPRFPFTEGATGSLGQGLALAVGQAYTLRTCYHSPARVWVLLGDSELSEGSNWEAIEWAGTHKLSSVIALVDHNHLGQTGPTPFAEHPEARKKQFESFGWTVYQVEGNDIEAVYTVLQRIMNDLESHTIRTPVALIASTVKGYGLPDDIAGRNGYHGKAFSADDLPRLYEYLAEQTPNVHLPALPLVPCKPCSYTTPSLPVFQDPKVPFCDTQHYAPRKAVAQALASYAQRDTRIVCVDADVKNSTYTEYVEHVAPERFIQVGVAEQCMVGVASGAAQRGMQAWIGTFAAFLTRAADQIRMSGIGRVPLRVIGTHVGISIGADGPSQMGLEDIALFAAVPHARIFYPADYYASWAAVSLAHAYDHGISYIRTTRSELPVIYQDDTPFHWGGCHVHREHTDDVLTIAAAGITLHEALRAYDILRAEGILVRVIDVYSVIPLPTQALCAHGRYTRNMLLVVEDHYLHGGLGSLIAQQCSPEGIRVHCVAVTDIPCSGSMHDLMSWAGIDAAGICKAVRAVCKQTL